VVGKKLNRKIHRKNCLFGHDRSERAVSACSLHIAFSRSNSRLCNV